MSSRAIPHRSFSLKATQCRKLLFTPSLFRIAWINWLWILFNSETERVVTGSEYIIDGTYILQWKIKVSISKRFDVISLAA
jgi:hypothetical protein